jgi:3-oxoacyl-[acyl-carrier-protein] synthase II
MVTYAPAMQRIVITGIGVVTPFGTDTGAFTDALVEGRSAVVPLTQFPVDGCAARCAASVQGFDASRWIPPLKSRRMDMTSQYAIAAACQALDAAAFGYGEAPQETTGVAIGTYTGGGSRTEEFLEGLFRLGPIGAPALLFNATVANVAASLIGLELKFRGPNITISHKEVSGLTAAAHAIDLLRGGQARAIVTAGVDALYPLFFRVHDHFGVLSHDNGHPEGSRPFDATRNGFVLGEGAYAAVLETADAARERGAPAIGELLAIECGGSRAGVNQWPRQPGDIARVIRRAIDVAGVTPADIDVVYASANSSPGLDAVEAAALREVFGPLRPAVTTVKGALGEASAAGAASLAAAVLCGRRGVVPPVVGLRDVDPACGDLALTTSVAAAARGPVALVNGIASGGALVAAVVRAAA